MTRQHEGVLGHVHTINLDLCCVQKQVARTEQEILNRIREKEIHMTELKRKLDGVKVGQLVHHFVNWCGKVKRGAGLQG